MKNSIKYPLSLAALSLSASLFAQEHPNILWLTYEDTSPQFIGCYGDKDAHTPNIDSLASEGVRFTSAFSTGAVSSPSRFCLFTGIPACSMGTGNHRSNYEIPDFVKGFPYYLREVGYYTTNNSKTDYNMANARELTEEAWNESSKKAGWWNRKPGQPFFAIYNSMSSHQSRTMTNTWHKYEEQVLKQLDDSEKIAYGNLNMPEFYRNSPAMQKNFSRVYNSISLMDKEFGEWLKRLEKDGLKDSTIVFCFADHGEGITRGKGSALGFGYRVPFIAWFPPMYKNLSPWGSGVITDEVVSFEDLAPTMLALAGVKIPDYMKGRVFAGKKLSLEKKYAFSETDRTDESSEFSRSVTDGKYLYTRVFMPFQPFVRWNMYYDMSDIQKQIRSDYANNLLDKKQKVILQPRQAEYLYDLKEDKWEVKNLANDKAYQQKLIEMRNVLKNHLIECRDPHFMTEYTFIHSGKIPFDLAADTISYPIKKIVDAALLIGEGKSVKKTQLKLLENENPYIRYWAGIGLFSQSHIGKKDESSLLKCLHTETFEPEKVNIILTLYKNFDNPAYLKMVQQLIKSDDPELLRITLHLLITLEKDKQAKLIDDIKNKFNEIKQNKIKGMFNCTEFMRLFLHIHEGLEITSDDDQ